MSEVETSDDNKDNDNSNVDTSVSNKNLYVTYSFNTNGGNEIADIKAIYLSTMPIPKKEGYYFLGWYDNEELSGDIIKTPYYSSESTIFYAKWIECSGNQNEGLEISSDGVIIGIGSCKDTELILCMPVAASAFQYCYDITKVTFMDGVTSIGYNAFNNCYNLTSIIISGDVTSIGNGAFSYCYSLNSVIITGKITTIGTYTFEYCSDLTSVVIPSSVTTIGNCAFYGCTKLKVYAEAESKPNEWSYDWDNLGWDMDSKTTVYCTVVWGYTEEA
jgi:uncharacterized repeat protein (TIGR02543 family)